MSDLQPQIKSASRSSSLVPDPAASRSRSHRFAWVRASAGRRAGLVARAMAMAVSWALIAVIRGYQWVISPLIGPTCKYYPSCSSYAIQALRLRGPVIGLWLLASRLARCNPWSRGGVDDVPLPGRGNHWRHRCNTTD